MKIKASTNQYFMSKIERSKILNVILILKLIIFFIFIMKKKLLREKVVNSQCIICNCAYNRKYKI